MSDKPREWWIAWPSFIKDPLGQVYNVLRMVTNYAFEDAVHVIEYSAYEQAIRERDEIRTGLERVYSQAESDRAALKDYVDLLQAARAERDEARANQHPWALQQECERLRKELDDARAAARSCRQGKSKSAKLVEALKEADQHLDFFVHVEKRYTESGKEMVAFDKCAEIRAAHAVIKASLQALAEYESQDTHGLKLSCPICKAETIEKEKK